MDPVKELAFGTERAVRPDAVEIAADSAEAGKALLVRDTSVPFGPRALTLVACTSDELWARYEEARVVVEAAFGLDAAAARAMVRRMRERAGAIGLRLWLATGEPDGVVGGIGAFRYPGPTARAARLQEVDVFPAHRGRGLGTALLEGVRRVLVAEDVATMVVGADEEDWPLDWYRRLGFRQVVRVNRSPKSGAREDDELLGRPGHRDIAVDSSFDARAERLRVEQDDEVELEPLHQFRGQ
jgi:ribosomal protein S18 acetylase RimI-like enzyme